MNSLRVRFLVGFGLVLGGTLLALAVVFERATRTWVEATAAQLAVDKAVICARVMDPRSPKFEGWMQSMLNPRETGVYLTLFDERGNWILQSENTPHRLEFSPGALQLPVPVPRSLRERRELPEPMMVATFPFYYMEGGTANLTGFAQAAVPLRMISARLAPARQALRTTGAVCLVVSMILAGGLVNRWLNAVHQVADDARQLAVGDLTRRRLFTPRNAPELANLTASFNSLLDRLADANRLQNQFIADASHELRTPLATIRTDLDVALRRERPVVEYQRVLQECRSDLLRLSRLIEGLLALARMDQKSRTLLRKPVNFGVVCRDTCDQLLPLAAERGIQMELNLPPDLMVTGDSEALGRVVRNLVENALAYTPSGDGVRISARVEEGLAVLDVTDEGRGIEPEHLPRIFDRFFRVDAARTRDLGGTGLGLAIVKSVVEAHGGLVTVKSTPGKGSVFRVSLPQAGRATETAVAGTSMTI